MIFLRFWPDFLSSSVMWFNTFYHDCAQKVSFVLRILFFSNRSCSTNHQYRSRISGESKIYLIGVLKFLFDLENDSCESYSMKDT